MDLDVIAEDLYPHKLATILGRGKRLHKLLKAYPTESRFKQAALENIGQVIGIKNHESKIMRQLADLDQVYYDLITPRFTKEFSISPGARTIMGIDTEYLLSPLDSIQFVVYQNESFYTGFIFTNERLASAVVPKRGIELLRKIIADFKPDIIVGHNFNCDISVLERVYENEIPELHQYDDTMKIARKSHVANIVGSAALKSLIQRIFSIKVIEVQKAYRNLTSFVEYGLMDAVFPIHLRDFLLTGEKPYFLRPTVIDYMILATNKIELRYEKIHFPVE